jgi:UMF1 family MFS transporter
MSAPSHDSATGAPVAPDPAHLALDPTGFSAPPSGPEHALDPRNRRRRALGSWALYDLANTVWSYGIFSYAIGLYLTQDGVMGEAAGNLWLQIAISVSVGLNALVSPAIGAMSDRSGRRMPYLLWFTALAIVPAMLIPGMPVPVAIVLFCLSNFGYQSALIYYDATLRLVSTPANRGWVSGVGNGLGYFGTILIGLIILFGGLTVEQVFVVAPALFAILAIPIFLLVKETPEPNPGASHASLAATLRTIRALDEYPGLRRFLLARFFYTDAQNTVIAIMAVFAVQAVGFAQAQANYVLVALATTAVVGGIVWGRLTDTRGPKATLRAVLTLWAIALVVGGLFISPIPFILAGVVLGFGFGGLAGADRVLMYRLSPPERLGEFYGLYGLVGKGSQVIGGLLYGATVALLLQPLGVGAYQIGILTLLATMLVGMWLLRTVPEKREG